MAGTRAPTLLTPAFVALTLAELAYFTASGMLLALTPLLVTGPWGSGAASVGVVMGAFSVTTLVLRPWTGRYADRRGRRPLLLGGLLLFTLAVLGHLVVPGLAWLVGLRAVLGAAEAFFFVAAFAALADLAPPDRTGAALSLNSLALFAGTALGPLVAQPLLRLGGFTAGWLGAAAFAALATVLAARVPETLPEPVTVDGPRPLVHRAALRPGLGLFTGVAATSGFLAFAVLRAQQVGLERWSLVLLLFGATVVVCRAALADLPDRVAPRGLATAALVVCAVGALTLALLPSVAGLLVGTAVLALGGALLTPAVFADVFATARPEQRGSAAGTVSVFIDLGLGAGPLLVGLVAAVHGIAAGFACSAALAAAGSLLLAARRRAGRGPTAARHA